MPWVKDARARKRGVGQATHLRPRPPALLATTPQSASPKVSNEVSCALRGKSRPHVASIAIPASPAKRSKISSTPAFAIFPYRPSISNPAARMPDAASRTLSSPLGVISRRIRRWLEGAAVDWSSPAVDNGFKALSKAERSMTSASPRSRSVMGPLFKTAVKMQYWPTVSEAHIKWRL
ncbi:hypothetical protein P3T22_006605 [Paraburkholderia sp. GAS348]